MFRPDAPRLKARLSQGPTIGAAWFSLGTPALIELAVRAGVDAVALDLQHGLWDRAGLEAAVGLCPPETPCLVRVQDDSDAALARALDAGAEGVIVPMVESGAQAARAAAACHYPPLGRRSAGGIRTIADPGYKAAASSAIAVGMMIETVAGVAAVADIASAALVDFVFIGPGDLLLSVGGDRDALESACTEVLAACRRVGRPCGIFAMGLAEARRRAEQGFALTTATSDVLLAREALARAADWRTG